MTKPSWLGTRRKTPATSGAAAVPSAREGAALPQPEDALRRFFTHVRNGNFEAAYLATTPGLRETTSPHQLAEFLQSRGLLQVAHSAWVVRGREGSVVRLEGAAVADSGQAVPLAARLQWAGQDWQVAYLALNNPARLPDPLGLPPLPQQAQWVQTTLTVVGRSLASQDYTALHRHLSLSAQATTSPAQLAQGFLRLRDRQINILPAVENLPMVITASNVVEGGRMEVSGHYDSRPLQVRFQLAYEQEGGAWRPVVIRVDALPPPGT